MAKQKPEHRRIRAALDEFQAACMSHRTLEELASARVNFAEEVATLAGASPDDRRAIVNAILGRSDRE